MIPIVTAVLMIVEEFLKLKILKEQTKYEDKKMELEKGLRNEFSKPIWDGKDVTSPAQNFRNDALLADLFSQLCELAHAIATAPRQTNPNP